MIIELKLEECEGSPILVIYGSKTDKLDNENTNYIGMSFKDQLNEFIEEKFIDMENIISIVNSMLKNLIYNLEKGLH